MRVQRPGQVSDPEAAALVERLTTQTRPTIAARARTYARAGQVVELRVVDGQASAAIQGSDADPYAVWLVRGPDGSADATCTCPYGCDEVEWCKHAAALAYVVADLLHREPAIAAAWLGHDAPATEAAATGEEVAVLLARLRTPSPPAVRDCARQWAEAFAVLAPPDQ